MFSLIASVARAQVNIAEIVSTYTEFIFVVAEQDFTKTVAIFAEMHKREE